MKRKNISYDEFEKLGFNIKCVEKLLEGVSVDCYSLGVKYGDEITKMRNTISALKSQLDEELIDRYPNEYNQSVFYGNGVMELYNLANTEIYLFADKN
ncbi:MAG: hypothetical protein Q4D45_09870 [Lachnospiraceae bacterium]|nr:hypothetical protein [Lachnospiraceae bacterium]